MDQLDFHLDEELRALACIAEGAEFAEGLAAFFASVPAAGLSRPGPPRPALS